MTATNPAGGPAIPVSIDTTRRVKGGAAIPVYGYAGAPTDGRPAQGGAAQAVRVLTAADLKQNGGTWTLEGRPYALPVYTAPATARVMGGPAIAVYPINAWPPSSAAPVVTPWYLSGGIAPASVIAAYKPKGAASLAASYANVDNPATHTLTVGAVPGWDATNGWIGDGAAYLITDFALASSGSAIVLYSDATSADEYLFGARDGGTNGIALAPNEAGAIYYYYDTGFTIIAPQLASGVVAIAGQNGYRNGVLDGALTGAPIVSSSPAVAHILSFNLNGVTYGQTHAKVKAIAFYSVVITAPQVAAVATAMAAL